MRKIKRGFYIMNKRFFALILLASFSVLLLLASFTVLASTTVTVTPSNLNGWAIAPDGTVPVNFTTSTATIGSGSLQFGPIDGGVGANKFIMAAPASGMLLSDFSSFSYDFLVSALNASHFYINVYVDSSANGLGTTASWYDCRYDYVPSGALGVWNTAGFNSGYTGWVNIANPLGSCPSSLSANAAGSVIMFLVVNGGQSNSSDAGLAGGFDNIIITTSSGATIYDFEPDIPTVAEAADDLIAYINQLNAEGAINNGQTNALIRKVENALAKVGRGQVSAAINQLNALINQANDLASEGVLTAAQAQELIDLTNQLIASINAS
jgi:FIMAH domain